MSLWAVLRAMGGGGPTARLYELSLHTTAVALGVVAGFVSQIPGGLFVREWVAGELMRTGNTDAAIGMISAVIFRLVLLSVRAGDFDYPICCGLARLRKALAAATSRTDHASAQR